MTTEGWIKRAKRKVDPLAIESSYVPVYESATPPPRDERDATQEEHDVIVAEKEEETEETRSSASNLTVSGRDVMLASDPIDTFSDSQLQDLLEGDMYTQLITSSMVESVSPRDADDPLFCALPTAFPIGYKRAFGDLTSYLTSAFSKPDELDQAHSSPRSIQSKKRKADVPLSEREQRLSDPNTDEGYQRGKRMRAFSFFSKWNLHRMQCFRPQKRQDAWYEHAEKRRIRVETQPTNMPVSSVGEEPLSPGQLDLLDGEDAMGEGESLLASLSLPPAPRVRSGPHASHSGRTASGLTPQQQANIRQALPQSQPVLLSFDAFEQQKKLTTHREPLNDYTHMLLVQCNSRVRQIEAMMADPNCHFYAGQLEHPDSPGLVLSEMPFPFVYGDELEEADKEKLHTLVPLRFRHSNKPPLIVWGASGDPVMTMLETLPFVQIAPVVGANASKTASYRHPPAASNSVFSTSASLRQDLVYSTGYYRIDTIERKDWYDALNGYKSNHYQSQRATMTRYGVPNCQLRFLLEEARYHTQQPARYKDAMVAQEYSMQVAMESHTLHGYGIATRKVHHFFDTVLMVLTDVYELLKHGSGKYDRRAAGLSTCNIRDNSLSASEAMGVGRKADLDRRGQFVMSLRGPLMGLGERPLNALYDRYGSLKNLIMAYEKCAPEMRDSLLTREVVYKDADDTFSLFSGARAEAHGVAAAPLLTKTGRKKAIPKPFGPKLSMRVHRFLYSEEEPPIKQSKGRTNRRRDAELDEDEVEF